LGHDGFIQVGGLVCHLILSKVYSRYGYGVLIKKPSRSLKTPQCTIQYNFLGIYTFAKITSKDWYPLVMSLLFSQLG